MQRVVRSTLAGLLTFAGLAACGDKVTIPPATTQNPSQVVRSVTVSPQTLSLNVGQTAPLAASVNADEGVTDRTVTWTSGNTAIATVSAAGVVTGVAAGNTTITAASKANPQVTGAAQVTIGGGSNNPPSVTISSINQNPTNAPANLTNAGGQLDVVLNVETNGQSLRSVSATMSCPGGTTMTQSQTVSGASDVDASAAAVPIVLPFNTALFNATTGAPSLRNGSCTLAATATTGPAGSTQTQTATTNLGLTLNNIDGVVISESFAGYTNVLGATTPTTATDAAGLPWRGGSVTISVLPVLYSGTSLVGGSVSVTLPGATNATQTIPVTAAGAATATYSATATTGSRVTGLTLAEGLNGAPCTGPNGCFEANGVTRRGVTPIVTAVNAAGNSIALAALNFTQPSLNLPNPAFRLDNQAPAAPTTFQIPARQQGWVNGAYTFAGVSGAQGDATAKYVSGGDAGVANAANSNGVNPQTTLSWYYGNASSFTRLTGGTGTGSACVTTGLTQAATGNDIPPSQANTQYTVRVLEADKLGNIRCMDIGTNGAIADGTAGNMGTFGVDVVAPTANLIDAATSVASNDPCPFTVGGVQQVPAAGVPCGSGGAAIKTYQLGISDNASGFSSTPVMTTLTRLTATGGQACVIGGANCAPSAQAVSAISADNATGTDGYYTYTATVNDLARNTAPTLTRVTLVDRAAPVMGGIAVPATITGGQAASFGTSATDNVDLAKTDYTLTYPAIAIRSAGPDIGVAFDNVLTTASSFSLNIPSFIRSIVSTSAGNAPQAGGARPTQIDVRAYDAAGNVSAPGTAAINAANIPITTPTDYSANQANGAQFLTFAVTNAVANISNCQATPCTPANPSTVSLTAAAVGTEGANFQFSNPFTRVEFYYNDPVTTEWIFIGSAVAPVVTDNQAATQRTFTWTLASWDPPVALGVGAINIRAIGVNAAGDGLMTQSNANITLTNP